MLDNSAATRRLPRETRYSEPRLLVIDDDNFTIMAVRRKIRQLGFSIDFDHATDGVDGMHCLWHPVYGAPATILLDYHMPRMNGVEMLCRMDTMAERAQIDVFLMTSSDIPRSSFDGVASSVAGFIVKDLNFQGLEAALIRHQSRHEHLARTA
ncbi:MAG: response regulator [Pseudomonadota bacterium]